MTDENNIDVEATDENLSNRSMEERVELLRSKLSEYPTERIAFIGSVVVLKGEPVEIDGEPSLGHSAMIIGEELEGYDGPKDVLASARMFNEKLEDAKLPLDEQTQQPGLEDLLGISF